jgi:hypothetical protein
VLRAKDIIAEGITEAQTLHMLEKCVNEFVDLEMFKFTIRKAEETNFSNQDLLSQAKILFEKY